MREILAQDEELRNRLNGPHEFIRPDRPDIWFNAGFSVYFGTVIAAAYAFKNYRPYKYDGEFERYAADTFSHQVHAAFVPLMELHEYLNRQIEIDETEGKFYDAITLREGDKRNYGATDSSIGLLFNDAETLLLWLEKGGSSQRGREAGSFPYIQVCYLIEI